MSRTTQCHELLNVTNYSMSRTTQRLELLVSRGLSMQKTCHTLLYVSYVCVHILLLLPRKKKQLVEACPCRRHVTPYYVSYVCVYIYMLHIHTHIVGVSTQCHTPLVVSGQCKQACPKPARGTLRQTRMRFVTLSKRKMNVVTLEA